MVLLDRLKRWTKPEAYGPSEVFDLTAEHMISPPQAKAPRHIGYETPSLMERMGGGLRNLASGASSRAINTASVLKPKSLWERAKAVGASLKDPAVLKQAAAEMALSAATMGVAKTAAAATLTAAGIGAAGAFAGITATTAIVGGLLKSRRQYHAAIEKEDRSIGGYWSHVWNHKKQLAKNMAGSAITGALGAGIGSAVGGLWEHFHHAASTLPAAAPLHQVVTAPKPLSVAPVVPVGPSDLDKALDIVREHKFLSRHVIEMAQKGDLNALKEVRHAINTDGISADDKLLPGLDKAIAQAQSVKTVVVAPVHSAPLPKPVITTPAPVAAPVAIPGADFSNGEKILAGTAAAGATVVAGQAAINAAAPALAAAAMGTPDMSRSRNAIAQTCAVTSVVNSPDAYNVSCPHTALLASMNPGDKLRIEYTDPNNSTASADVVSGAQSTMDTKSFESSFLNDTKSFGGLMSRLRGIAASKFNMASNPATLPADVANDNVSTTAPSLQAANGPK